LPIISLFAALRFGIGCKWLLSSRTSQTCAGGARFKSQSVAPHGIHRARGMREAKTFARYAKVRAASSDGFLILLAISGGNV
jgi:hypothetical protein